MLKSFAFMEKEIDIAFFYEVNQEINGLKWYFYKFTGANAEEAMQRTLMHTITHFQAEKGNLSAYVKKLAREITKENSKLVYVDFIDETLAEDDEGDLKPNVDTGRVQDFSKDVLREMELQVDRRPEVINLALEFMDKFLMLCEALMRHDTSTRYYPEVFIKQCLGISTVCPNFNRLCLDLYKDYAEDFKWFLELTDSSKDIWKESDFLLISNAQSKRMKLVSPDTNEEVADADLEDWYFVGKLGEGENKKRVLKVNYYDVWEMMCDLIDAEETNEMKFVIDNSYIIRTFGGSLSILNPDLYNEYDLVRMEILTNILYDTGGRILNVGSENIYLVCNSNYTIRRNKRTVCDHTIEFIYEDITDTIS